MPPLFRHVVPNVPAWTAGNGKIVYRGGVPSCQKLMKFSMEWGGNLNFAPWAAYEWEGADEPDWLDLTVSAAEINTALAAFGFADDKTYYNTTYPFTISGVDVMPNVYFDNRQLVDNYAFQRGGATTKQLRASPMLLVGIDWDAANQFWRWEARIYRMRMWFHFGAGAYDYHVCDLGFQTSGDRYALYQSAQSTQDIRAGNGVTLNFVGIHTTSAQHPYAASVLSGTSLTVSAQYA